MTEKKERGQRDLDLMMKSYRALEAEQNNPSTEPFEREPVGRRADDRLSESAPAPDDEGDDGDVVMYRGRQVRRGNPATPGAGSSQGKPSWFRGVGSNNEKRRSSDGGKSDGGKSVSDETADKGDSSENSDSDSDKYGSIDKIKESLVALAELHEEGLITKAEFNKKRRQLLDRL